MKKLPAGGGELRFCLMWLAGRTGSKQGKQGVVRHGQLFSSKAAPQERQWTVIRPLPRGTRICWPQLGHLK